MSQFIIIPHDVITDTRLGLRQFRVLCALFSHRDPKSTNIVFPSRERLSEITGYNVSRISATTRELSLLGWIVKTGDGGRGKITRYTLSETVPELETVTKLGTIKETVPESVLNGTRIGTETVPESGTHNGIDHIIDHNIYGAKQKRKMDIPPNHEESIKYGLKIGLAAEDVEAFIDHHDARGWIMSNGKKMVNWEAGLRTWARSPYRKTTTAVTRTPVKPSNLTQEEFTNLTLWREVVPKMSAKAKTAEEIEIVSKMKSSLQELEAKAAQ